MRIVTVNQLQLRSEQSEELEKDGREPKVLRQNDGLPLKILGSRQRLWLARLRTQARRSSADATRLNYLGAPAHQAREALWIDLGLAFCARLCSPLTGEWIDKPHYRDSSEFDAQIPTLAAFIRELHAKGTYFRSLHLGAA